MAHHQPSDSSSTEAQLLAAYLAERNVQCPKCHYNLRGAQSAACAECGTPIALTVGAVEQPTAPWLIAVFLHATAMVACGMYAFILPIVFILDRESDALLILAPFAAGFATALALLLLLVLRRHRIWRWRWPLQWLLCISIVVVLAAVVGGFEIANLLQQSQ